MGKLKTALKLLRGDPSKFKIALSEIFAKSKFSHIVPDKMFLKMRYKTFFGKKPSLTNPQTFNEKLLWLKLYDRNPKYTDLVDKYEVKKYIAEAIGEQYIIPTLAVYDDVDAIDLSVLPKQFVLKCTHDSGSIVICKDKDTFDITAAKKKLQRGMRRNLFWWGREWPYKDVKPRIIAEQYMEDAGKSDLTDYKFFCFNGEVKFLYVSAGLSNHSTAHINYVSLNWEKEPFKRTDFAEFEELPPKPANFEKMLAFSEQLSKNIPFLRVDFYDINKQLYFGELTFFPGSGFTAIEPEEWDYKLGSWIELPKINK